MANLSQKPRFRPSVRPSRLRATRSVSRTCPGPWGLWGVGGRAGFMEERTSELGSGAPAGRADGSRRSKGNFAGPWAHPGAPSGQPVWTGSCREWGPWRLRLFCFGRRRHLGLWGLRGGMDGGAPGGCCGAGHCSQPSVGRGEALCGHSAREGLGGSAGGPFTLGQVSQGFRVQTMTARETGARAHLGAPTGRRCWGGEGRGWSEGASVCQALGEGATRPLLAQPSWGPGGAGGGSEGQAPLPAQ